MMSQNRQAARDRIATGLDYQVNLRAELKILRLHEKFGRILSQLEQGATAPSPDVGAEGQTPQKTL